jgi:hypothetical protein
MRITIARVRWTHRVVRKGPGKGRVQGCKEEREGEGNGGGEGERDGKLERDIYC